MFNAFVFIHAKTCFQDCRTAFLFFGPKSITWLSRYLRQGLVVSTFARSSVPCLPSLCNTQPFLAFHSEPECCSHHPTPRPTFTAKAEDAVDLLHHSFAFYPPRHFFASVYPCISPRLVVFSSSLPKFSATCQPG